MCHINRFYDFLFYSMYIGKKNNDQVELKKGCNFFLVVNRMHDTQLNLKLVLNNNNK